MDADDNARSLIPLPDLSLTKATWGKQRILSAMVGETLALARREPRFKIGESEWCEPDYRQILLWAAALGLEPEEVIRRLLGKTLNGPTIEAKTYQETVFENGRMLKLNWDLAILPLAVFKWIEGLEIEYFRIVSSQYDIRTDPSLISCPSPVLNLALPKLRELICEWSLALDELDLSQTPSLERLRCAGNRLAELDLCNVPGLTFLDCGPNQLIEIDLSSVPMLTTLNCGFNQLTEINLSKVPRLSWLSCKHNRLTEINLSDVPMLTLLSCGDNLLTELELGNMPRLKLLDCDGNQITELDLSRVPTRLAVKCRRNQLTKLDLSRVPNLCSLACSGNRIDQLDIRSLHNLEQVEYDAGQDARKPQFTRLIQREDQHFQYVQ